MSHPFETLTPDLVLDAVESIGFLSDARVLALNSYENRVYQVGIEDAEPLIAKFYRPDRWTDAAILEEHSFTAELADCEVPVVAPLIHKGETLFEHSGFRFTGAWQPGPALSPGPIARPPACRRRHPPIRAP
jgi:Ser/Thr protein kinase RdoA (MazF antagonist)